jgi:hypothetical protein
MSLVQNKSIIFYSKYRQDELSALCLQEINKSEELKRQFILICIHHPEYIDQPAPYRIPVLIQQLASSGRFPVLAISGFKEPIFAGDALSWLKDSSTSGPMPMSEAGDNCSVQDSGESFIDPNYVIGFVSGKGEIGKSYSNIEESANFRIDTFDETSNKSDAKQQTNQRLEQLHNQRKSEFKPLERIGGAPETGRPGMQSQSGRGFPQVPSSTRSVSSLPTIPYHQQQFGETVQLPQRPMPQGTRGGY